MNRYRWNVELVETFTSMSLTGIAWDAPAAAAMRESLVPRAWEAQAAVDALAGVQLPASMEALLAAVGEVHCHSVRLRTQLKGRPKVMRPVVGEDGSPKVNKAGKPVRKAHAIPPRSLSWELLRETANLAGGGPINRLRALSESAQSGARDAEIAALLGVGVNVESPAQVIAALDRLGLPAKFKRGARVEGDDATGRTSDEEALLDLFLKTGHPVTRALLEARGVRGALSWLENTKCDEDGRVRCSFANPGSETGRVLTRTWHSGSGGNLQAVSKGPINFRALMRADPGHLMAQCDYKSADAWTVAARCAQQGDRTMLDDLQAGIRIPSLLALMMGGATFAPSFDRADLRKLCKAVVKDWRDFAYKVGQHGSNYMGSAGLIQRGTIKESWFATGTPVDPGLAFCQRVQQLYLGRYWGLPLYWADVERQVRRDGTLRAASGQVREFLSRRWTGQGANRRLDHSCHKEAVAHEAQAVTTYTTNLALWRAWTAPENIRPNGTRIIQPLLHGHDALLFQFPEHLPLGEVGRKLAAWFSNPIRVGNITITIPVESAYGASWGACETPFPIA